MRKKLILSVVFVLAVLIIGYTYSIFNNKNYFGGDDAYCEGGINKTINVKNNVTLLKVDIEAVKGEAVNDENGFCELPSIEEARESNSFKVSNEQGEMVLIVEDNNGNVVKEEAIELGNKVCKQVLLTSKGNYSVRLRGEEFIGLCKIDIYGYKIF